MRDEVLCTKRKKYFENKGRRREVDGGLKEGRIVEL